MTRIETALQRMRDEAQVMVWHGDLTKAAATPTGQALGALVEAAEALRGILDEAGVLREGYSIREANSHDRALIASVDAFRAATEPQPVGGER